MYSSKFKVISQNILLAIIGLVPLLFLPHSTFSLDPLKTTILLMTGVVFVLGIIILKIKQDSFFVTKNILTISIYGVILSALVSTILSNNINISLFGRQPSDASLFGVLSLFALAFVVYTFFQDLKEKTRLFLTIYTSGVFIVLVHLCSIVLPFFPSFNFFVNNTINTIGGWYDLGLYALFITLSSVLVLQFLKHSRFYKIIGWIGLITGMLVMILVNSSTTLVLGIVFSLLYIVFNAIIQHDFDVQHRISHEALIVLIVSVIFLLIGGKTSVLLNSAFNIQVNEIRPSLMSTLDVSKQVLQHNPISGVGLDRFDTAWLLYRPAGINLSQFWDTDFSTGYSTILSVPVNQGILGILAWLLFICVSIYYAFKLLFVSTEQKSDLFMYMYSVFGYIFFLCTLLIYTPSVVLVGLMFIFLGLFLSNLKHAGLITYKEIAITQNPRISFGYILSLVLLLIGFVYIGYVQISQYTSRVIFERASADFTRDNNLQKIETQIDNALFIYYSDVYTRALAQIGLSKINQITQDKNLTQEQAVVQFTEVLRGTMDYARYSAGYDLQSYDNRIFLINIYKTLIPLGVKDAKDEAIKTIEATKKLTPDNPTLFLETARVYALSKEYDLAIEQIKKAIELKPNYIDAAFLLSQIQVEKGQIDEAVSSIQSAIQIDVYNPNLRFQLGLLYYNQQKYGNAVTTFENAVKLSPNFANAKYFLGLSYYKNSQATNAVAVFENLALQIPNNQEITLILNNLKAGIDPFSGVQPPLDNKPEEREELPLEDKEDSAAKEVKEIN
jgi:tetratricopeptide (TPR) repeat protein